MRITHGIYLEARREEVRRLVDDHYRTRALETSSVPLIHDAKQKVANIVLGQDPPGWAVDLLRPEAELRGIHVKRLALLIADVAHAHGEAMLRLDHERQVVLKTIREATSDHVLREVERRHRAQPMG